MATRKAAGKRHYSDDDTRVAKNTGAPASKKRRVVLNGRQPDDKAWCAMYAKLLQYKSEHGDCRVTRHYEKDPALGCWLSRQRSAHKTNILSDERRQKLESIGVEWSLKKMETFDSMCARFIAFKEEHGHCNVPNKYGKDLKLGQWVSDQRNLKKKGKLLPERITKLDSVGFLWSAKTGPQATTTGKPAAKPKPSADSDSKKRVTGGKYQPHYEGWNDMYAKLLEFEEENGHTRVPKKQDPKLGRWVIVQRQAYKSNSLSDDRIEKLESIGFEWILIQHETFDSMYERLLAYREEHGHCEVPMNYEKDTKLGRWVREQSTRKLQGKLLPERISKLDSIGFSWKAEQVKIKREESFDAMYACLVAYKEENGHCQVPARGQDPKLGNWVHKQRNLKRKGELSPERVSKLDSIGFTWSLFEIDTFDTMFERLVAFKEENGHCEVPRLGKYLKLGYWVCDQRTSEKNGKLLPERVEKLESIGFSWTVKSPRITFDSMCERLLAYKEENGHCKVPNQYKKDPILGAWVGHLRNKKKIGKLSPERVKKLNSIGFSWSVRSPRSTLDSIWERLLAYKEENGHCDVPSRYKNDPKLGSWVHKQRKLKNQGKLSPERLSKLDSIGISWSIKPRIGTPQASTKEKQAAKPKPRVWVRHFDDPNYV